MLFQRSCLCNGTNYTEVPLVFTSSGRDLELHLLALNMSSLEDPDSIFFEATFEFVKGPYVCKESRRRIGNSGEASLSIEDVIICKTNFTININYYMFILNCRSNAAPDHGISNHHFRASSTFGLTESTFENTIHSFSFRPIRRFPANRLQCAKHDPE